MANSATTNSPKIVTLRNPLFQQASNDTQRQQQQQQQLRNQLPLDVNQPAAIIKNENGMFTIRNIALHQALTNGVGTNFRQYSSDIYGVAEPAAPVSNFSYFSDGLSGPSVQPPHLHPQTQSQPQPQPPQLHSQSIEISTPISSAACTAIVSEVKSAQQMKNNLTWNSSLSSQPFTAANGDIFNNMSHLNPQQSRSYSPFDYGFNSDFVGASPTPHSQPTPNYFTDNFIFPI